MSQTNIKTVVKVVIVKTRFCFAFFQDGSFPKPKLTSFNKFLFGFVVE